MLCSWECFAAWAGYDFLFPFLGHCWVSLSSSVLIYKARKTQESESSRVNSSKVWGPRKWGSRAVSDVFMGNSHSIEWVCWSLIRGPTFFVSLVLGYGLWLHSSKRKLHVVRNSYTTWQLVSHLLLCSYKYLLKPCYFCSSILVRFPSTGP